MTDQKREVREARRVLVLEDEANSRLAMERFFNYYGYRVASAASAREAMEVACRCPPDVLVCDWKLDGGSKGADDADGVDAAEQLQRRFGSSVILITAYRLAELKSKARRTSLNVAAYYRKPLSLAGLAQTIDSLPPTHH
jgi:two-component system, response regulator, stage 0 sporulation protein F